MKRLNLYLTCALLTLASPAVAQDVANEPQAPTTAARATDKRQPVNVKLDITINDQTAGGQPLKKSVSLLLADGFDGRVRSTGLVHVQVPNGIDRDSKPVFTLRPLFQVELNVDAMVTVLQADRLRAGLTIQYTPGIAGATLAQESARPSPLNESVTVILTSGKPLVITQAADPVSDRKVTVEVTATIMR